MRRVRRNPVNCRAIRERIRDASVGLPVDVTKMHGHMTITLTDAQTGKQEIIEEDNMMTNALQEYFKNCGFLNFPNVNQNNMVEELLGGVMGFDTAISENASIVHVPAGCKMTFNGSVGTLNNSAPTELGSYSADESGWQQDGSYVQTYDFSTSQANGTISCVCLTGKNYGYAGEGNCTSQVQRSTKISITNLSGTMTEYTVMGNVFGINLTDSSCYSFVITGADDPRRDVETQDVHCYIRKYRWPINKINIKGTQTTPILLSEQEITMDSDFLENYNIITAATGRYHGMLFKSFNGNLLIFNYTLNEYDIWGDTFTQRMWVVTPSGTVTKTTITNTSGDTLPGMRLCIPDGNYIFFATSAWNDQQSSWYGIDTTKIYVLNRTTGAIGKIVNPYGIVQGNVNWDATTSHFRQVSSSGDGRLVTNVGYVLDAVNMEVYPTNATSDYTVVGSRNSVSGLIAQNGTKLYRDQCYIATINNLDNPVVKTSDKTMKVVYRITFDEQ